MVTGDQNNQGNHQNVSKIHSEIKLYILFCIPVYQVQFLERYSNKTKYLIAQVTIIGPPGCVKTNLCWANLAASMRVQQNLQDGKNANIILCPEPLKSLSSDTIHKQIKQIKWMSWAQNQLEKACMEKLTSKTERWIKPNSASSTCYLIF